jgi:hypothetical protein
LKRGEAVPASFADAIKRPAPIVAVPAVIAADDEDLIPSAAAEVVVNLPAKVESSHRVAKRRVRGRADLSAFVTKKVCAMIP